MNIPSTIIIDGVTMLVKNVGAQATPGEISAYMLDLKEAKEELAVLEGYHAKHTARLRNVEEQTAKANERLERARTMIALRTEGYTLVRQDEATAEAIAKQTGGVIPGSAIAGIPEGKLSSRLEEAAAGIAGSGFLGSVRHRGEG